MLCRCVGCPSPQTHLSRAHVCSKCLRLGHGSYECGPGLRARLRRYELSRTNPGSLPPERHCGIPGCPDPSSHEDSAHFCGRCFSSAAQCQYPCVKSAAIPLPPRIVTGVACPLCRAKCTAHLKPSLITGSPCVVCQDETKLCAFHPCGHVVACASCTMKIRFPTSNT